MFRKLVESVQEKFGGTDRPAMPKAATSARSAGTMSRWHSVSIQSGEGGRCEAARALAGQRFLSTEAPPLPLADCSKPDDCRCRYSKHGDRRTPGTPLGHDAVPLPHPYRRDED